MKKNLQATVDERVDETLNRLCAAHGRSRANMLARLIARAEKELARAEARESRKPASAA